MKRVVVVMLVLFIFCCAFKGYASGDYIDLTQSNQVCEVKSFPYQNGGSCPSGDLDHFTIRKITDFGERPAWSPDGKRIAFMDKEYGDAYEIDLATEEITCLTCEFKHLGFLRVHYMKDGDYLLVGPRKRSSDFADRFFYNGFYWMPADRTSPPVWMGGEHLEGVAVSRESRKIAFAKTWFDTPFMFPSRMYVAEVTTDGRIVNEHVVYRQVNPMEAQDFLPGDSGLIFASYAPNKEVYGVDISTGVKTNYSKHLAYEEPEGLFPDGQFVMVEGNRHAQTPFLDSLKSLYIKDIDIYMFRLDGTGQDIRRLTYFSDVPGQKANNPVASPEGCRVALMKSSTPEDWFKFQGESLGIYLIEFYECGQQ